MLQKGCAVNNVAYALSGFHGTRYYDAKLEYLRVAMTTEASCLGTTLSGSTTIRVNYLYCTSMVE